MMMMMEKEEKMEMMRPEAGAGGGDTAELFLNWGSRKRLRCVRIRSNNGGTATTNTSPPSSSHLSDPVHRSNSSARIRHRRIATSSSRFLSVTSNCDKSRVTRNSDVATAVSRRVSPEKEEKTYTTRGSVVAHQEENGGGGGGGKVLVQVDVNNGGDEHTNHHHHSYNNCKSNNYKNNNHNSHKNGGNGNLVWPKLYISLSSKEKEEDFLAMKGCKLPQRPKKRAKLIQRTILLVSPGAWLTDMSMERYEVREKKTSKKRPRGLKAMGNMDSDSE